MTNAQLAELGPVFTTEKYGPRKKQTGQSLVHYPINRVCVKFKVLLKQRGWDCVEFRMIFWLASIARVPCVGAASSLLLVSSLLTDCVSLGAGLRHIPPLLHLSASCCRGKPRFTAAAAAAGLGS